MAFLGDHPEFPALVRIVAERLQLLPVLVLKDSWATRVLRAIAADAPFLLLVTWLQSTRGKPNGSGT